MPHIEVSFPHRGDDGKTRKAGDVVYVSSAEARRLVGDSVAKVIPTPKPETPTTSTPTEPESTEKPKPTARTRKPDSEPTT